LGREGRQFESARPDSLISILTALAVFSFGYHARVQPIPAPMRLYAARFPIRRTEPVDRFGGDDFRSIEADNTSAFNCRTATGSTRWSNHAYGRAIDVNPIENRYVSDGTSSHRASGPCLDRSRHRPGTAYEGGLLVEAFRSVGWGWGGSWSGSVKDYQHLSVDGR
jgi:hypothetical protein